MSKISETIKAESAKDKLCDWLIRNYSDDFKLAHGKFYSCAPDWIADVIIHYNASAITSLLEERKVEKGLTTENRAIATLK